MSNKLATDITVFVTQYFGKERPFPVIDGKILSKPVFMTRPLFVKGDEFRVGLYHGDVYEVIDKKYVLFEPIREPEKVLRLLDPLSQSKSHVRLVVQSPGSRSNNIQVRRLGTWQEDLEATQHRIKTLLATMPTLRDTASEGLENYIRAFYAIDKIKSVGGDHRGSFRILPQKP